VAKKAILRKLRNFISFGCPITVDNMRRHIRAGKPGATDESGRPRISSYPAPPLTETGDSKVLSRLKGAASDRRVAAELLQTSGNISSYKPLLNSLQSAADDKTKIAILKALNAVGERCRKDEMTKGGFRVLKEFMYENLDKPEVIKEAFKAFQWTGTIEAICDVVTDIWHKTERTHPATSQLANRFFIEVYSGGH